MSSRARFSYRFVVLPLTLLVMASFTAAAAAKGPILYPPTCVAADGSVRATCMPEGAERPAPASASRGNGPPVAGIVAVAGLLLASGMLVTISRPDTSRARRPDLRGRFS